MFSFQDVEIQSGKYKLYGKLYLKNKNLPTILMLHGLGFHSFEYDDLAPLMVKEGYNCLAFDFRCCGKSEGRRGYWTLADYVEDTKNVIKYARENINDSIILYGNSLGAVVAIATAAQVSEHNIQAIISANCPTKISDFVMNPFRKILFAIAPVIFKIIPFRVNVNYFIPYTKILSNRDIIKKISSDISVSDARKFAVPTYINLFNWDMTKVVPKVKVPILILQGKEDRLQPISQATKLFDAANEPKELILTETGHLPNLENPEYIKNILVKWFNKILK